MEKNENWGNTSTVPAIWFLAAFILAAIAAIYTTSLENQLNTITVSSVLQTKQLEAEIELLKVELAEVAGPERVSVVDQINVVELVGGGELDE